MNNSELELKIKEILSIENFLDMMEAVFDFEKQYKGSEFYKKTKMPLIEVVKGSKTWYMLQLKDIGNKIQSLINNLDVSHLSEVIDQFGSVFEQENKETLDILNSFKDIVK